MLAPVDQLGGAAQALAGSGHHLFLGVGPRVQVLDASDPAAPRLVGQSGILPGVVLDLAVDGDRLWVTVGAWLVALDVSRPEAPVELARWSLAPRWYRHVVVQEGWVVLMSPGTDSPVAVLAAGAGPLAERTLRYATVSGQTRGAAVVGDRLYVPSVRTDAPARELGLFIFALRREGAWPDALWLERHVELDREPHWVAARDGMLLMVVTELVSGPRAYKVARYTLDGLGRPEVLLMSAVLVYDQFAGLLVTEDRLVITDGMQLRSYPFGLDGRPGSLELEVSLPEEAYYPAWLGLAKLADHLVVALPRGLWIYPDADAAPDAPEPAYRTPGWAMDLAVFDETLLMVAAGTFTGEVMAYDRIGRDPLARPMIVDVPLGGVAADPGRRLLFSTADRRLSAYGAADPNRPRLLGQSPDDDQPLLDVMPLPDSGMALVAGYQILGDFAVAFTDLMNMRNPAAPRPVLRIDEAPDWGGGQPAANGFLYVIGDERLRTLDLSDPAAVHERGPGFPLDVGDARVTMVAHGRRLYVALWDRLLVLDVGEVGSPKLAATLERAEDAGEPADGLIVDGRLVLLRDRGIGVFDLSEPDRPVLVASGPALGYFPEAISAFDGLLYVAEGDAGVTVWQLPADLPRPVEWTSRAHLPNVRSGT
jgi:hypothetical protein